MTYLVKPNHVPLLGLPRALTTAIIVSFQRVMALVNTSRQLYARHPAPVGCACADDSPTPAAAQVRKTEYPIAG